MERETRRDDNNNTTGRTRWMRKNWISVDFFHWIVIRSMLSSRVDSESNEIFEQKQNLNLHFFYISLSLDYERWRNFWFFFSSLLFPSSSFEIRGWLVNQNENSHFNWIDSCSRFSLTVDVSMFWAWNAHTNRFTGQLKSAFFHTK